MTEKKMRKWLKTFVMLLPVVFVVLFGVHLHRHELPASVEIQTGYALEPGAVNIIYEPQVIGPTNVNPYNSWTVLYYIQSTETFENITLFYNEGSPSITNPTASFVKITGNNVEFLTSFKITGVDNGANLIYFNVPNYTTYTEPLDVIAVSFNNYLDMYTNNNVFNIDEFYDWSVNTFFEGNAPLYYKPVFSIMVYEFVVELLFLMFSFITFLIRFAQKWIDGLYERRF